MAINTASKSGSRSGRPFTLLGALLAAVSLVLFVFLSTSISGGHGGGPLSATTTPVLVAARDIPIRTPLTSGDVRVASWNTNDVPPGAFTRISDVVDTQTGSMVAAVNILHGEPLSANLLAKTESLIQGGQTDYLPIPQGFVALTIATTELTGVAGFIQPNDYIEVVVVTSKPLKSQVRTVFTNLHVIKVGPASDQPLTGSTAAKPTPGPARSYNSMTVVATQCDAEYLYFFQSYSNVTVKYTLASYRDYQPQDTQPDSSCPKVTSAHGVSIDDVNRRWSSLLIEGQ